ncbi:MAG: hypothetical protein IPQ10_07930 [Saprospiraceae bacterium]|nr:hypothetical protein [Saprospiraceae bacterium]
MKQIHFLSGLVLLISITLSCSKDNDSSQACSNFPVLSQSITLNGTSTKLSIAQLILTSEAGEDEYNMSISTVSSDCNKQTTFSLNIVIPSGTKLNGTYPIYDYVSADIQEFSGNYLTQVISPTSQNIVELDSGTIKVVDKGSKLYNFDLSAVLAGTGERVTLKGDVQF